jgi:outer membrane protein assembly factor BamB
MAADTQAPLARSRPSHRGRTTRRVLGGAVGNGRLTSLAGIVLLVLLAVEGATIPAIHQLLSVHVFVGMLLLGPVALKLASTGYRLARYYTGGIEYVREGPPAPLMRVLVAPVLLASTLTLFGTGVALLAVPHRGAVLGLHKASFVVWFGAMTIHVLAYALRAGRHVLDDLVSPSPNGRLARIVVTALAIGGGIAVAVATYPLASPWFHFREHFDSAGAGAGSAIQTAAAVRVVARPRTDPAWLALGLPPVHPGPLPGYLLIADRNNNRALVVSPTGKVVWSYDNLRGPDDAFFTPGWHSIITNEEFNDTLAQVALRPKRVVWQYGHAGLAGSAPGYLNTPDDAYRLPNGDTTVADIRNCRIVELSPRVGVTRILGGSCAHDPPAGFSSPNGDTPLPDGGLLVTEIGGWIDRLDRRGRLVWSVRSPVYYPSDAQLLPDGRILVSSFTYPGKIVELTSSGRVTWSFGSNSGPDLLNKPSLAVRLPNGLIAANDDYGDRVILIDPRTKQIVWQYGHTGVASSAPGYLSKPDGIDFLPAKVVGRPAARAPLGTAVSARLGVATIGHLPTAASRVAVVATGGSRVMVLGGLVGGSSSTEILAGPPGRLRRIGSLPTPTHDDAAVMLKGTVYLLGGGQATSSNAVVAVSSTGRARTIGTLGEPLSDLGAAVVGKTAFIAGGYTGTRYATAILAFRGLTPSLATRLPVGLRYAGVASLDGRLYVAGGVTTAGTSAAVYRFDPAARSVVRVATLPRPVAHAPLVTLDGALYLIGGEGSDAIWRISPGGSVTLAGRLPQPLANAGAVAIGRAIYVFGGDGSDAVLRIAPRPRSG